MRREPLLIAGVAGLLCALLLGAAAALLGAPPVPADLLPPDAVVARIEPLAGGQRLVVARLGPRRGLHHLYAHLTDGGWRLRRTNVLPEDEEQVYFRRSMGGYLLEVAVVARSGEGRGGVRVTYLRCVRHLTCARR